MKIGIDISQVVYKGTGVSRYTENLVRQLLTDYNNDHFILFGSTLRRQAQLQEFISSLHTQGFVSIKNYHLPPQLLALLWNRLHVANIEKFVGNVDVFHTSDWTEPPAHIPKVTTIHDLIIFKYPQYLPKEIIENQKQKLAWVCKESAAIIAVSQATKADIQQYLKIADKKIHVIHNGVGKEFYPRGADEVRRVKLKYGLHKPYILCVGTREPRKNLHRVIEAFKLLQRSDIDLVIAGGFGWGSDVQGEKNIKTIGYINDTELPILYTGAHCFVYPSLYEGFGLPVIEAMACEVPVITSNSGSLAEISGHAALQVNPESVEEIYAALLECFSLSVKKRSFFIQTGKKHAAQFSWTKTAERTLEVYNAVV